ncbi:MAG TPA: F0F1 ATP synthase subunit A [Candidatus Methylomirabilis sp.]|nr:F0F1 ATP synthase subunit A [Candidatus Methylomirabilis sp.]
MPHQLWITAFLNKYFAGVANAILGVFHLQAHHPQAPIPNYVAMQIVVFVLLVLVFLLVRMSLSVDHPNPLQHTFEGIYGMIDQQGQEVIGHGHARFTNYLVTLGIFILTCNLIGLIPGFEAPTAVPSVPLGCALVTWIYYQMHGFRANGPGYIKHFLGPVWWLAPLMFVIEVASHLARILSLTVRLFANMFAGDMVTLVFFSLFPIAIPVVFMLLHVGVSFIQTYIFVLLATVYIGEAVAHEH